MVAYIYKRTDVHTHHMYIDMYGDFSTNLPLLHQRHSLNYNHFRTQIHFFTSVIMICIIHQTRQSARIFLRTGHPNKHVHALTVSTKAAVLYNTYSGSSPARRPFCSSNYSGTGAMQQSWVNAIAIPTISLSKHLNIAHR